MTGYDTRDARNRTSASNRIWDVQRQRPIDDWPPASLDILRANPEVTDAAPFTRGQLVLDVDRQLRAVRVQGLEPHPGPILERLRRLVHKGDGEFDLSGDTVVIGKALARKMGIAVGDTVILHSPGQWSTNFLEAQKTGKPPRTLSCPPN